MATKPQADLEAAAVEEAAGELAELERRRDEALLSVRRAEKRFAEMANRRTELSVAAFTGDEKATLELEGLEDEHEVLARSSSIASDAIPELERMVSEAKEKLQKAEFAVRKRQATERRKVLEEIRARRDKAADALESILAEEESKGFSTRREASKWLRERYRDRLRAWLR